MYLLYVLQVFLLHANIYNGENAFLLIIGEQVKIWTLINLTLIIFIFIRI